MVELCIAFCSFALAPPFTFATTLEQEYKVIFMRRGIGPVCLLSAVLNYFLGYLPPFQLSMLFFTG